MEDYQLTPMYGVLAGRGRYRSVRRPQFQQAYELFLQVPREFPLIYSEEFQDPENVIVPYQQIVNEMNTTLSSWNTTPISTRNYLFNVASTTLNRAHGHWSRRQPAHENMVIGQNQQASRIIPSSVDRTSEDKENVEPVTGPPGPQYL